MTAAPAMKRAILLISLLCVVSALWPATRTTHAAGAAAGGGGDASSPVHGLDPLVLVGLATMLLIAKVCGELFAKFNQPAVLGELVGGILFGALALVGVGWVERLRADAVIAALAEIGVIILLFEVGLESNLREMVEVGWSSLLVAVLGVVAPLFLGWGLAAYFLPGEPTLGHVFIGATLCATSVGITARVLKDMGRLRTREARIILGAAVIDDVLGLLILAVVAGAIKASAAGEALALSSVMSIALKSLA
ncbi:MAG TPA: cation:proton antiporter, partial [Pyrinomonadaceae bacterium]|nr:cation:proton antiporter [Pyrinomonadaceae bacterium]